MALVARLARTPPSPPGKIDKGHHQKLAAPEAAKVRQAEVRGTGKVKMEKKSGAGGVERR